MYYAKEKIEKAIPQRFKEYFKFIATNLLVVMHSPTNYIEFNDNMSEYRIVPFINGKDIFYCFENKFRKRLKIQFSTYCIFGNKKIFIPKNKYPKLFEETLLYGKSFTYNPRHDKYLTIYKAYESMLEKRNLEFGALRHALSHPHTKLKNKNTVKTLVKLFGTVNVDLSIYQQAKKFYEIYSQLIFETDRLLKDQINKLLPKKPNLISIFYML